MIFVNHAAHFRSRMKANVEELFIADIELQSASLLVILVAVKRCTIMDVFEVTGFVDILNIV